MDSSCFTSVWVEFENHKELIDLDLTLARFVCHLKRKCVEAFCNHLRGIDASFIRLKKHGVILPPSMLTSKAIDSVTAEEPLLIEKEVSTCSHEVPLLMSCACMMGVLASLSVAGCNPCILLLFCSRGNSCATSARNRRLPACSWEIRRGLLCVRIDWLARDASDL